MCADESLRTQFGVAVSAPVDRERPQARADVPSTIATARNAIPGTRRAPLRCSTLGTPNVIEDALELVVAVEADDDAAPVLAP